MQTELVTCLLVLRDEPASPSMRERDCWAISFLRWCAGKRGRGEEGSGRGEGGEGGGGGGGGVEEHCELRYSNRYQYNLPILYTSLSKSAITSGTLHIYRELHVHTLASTVLGIQLAGSPICVRAWLQFHEE